MVFPPRAKFSIKTVLATHIKIKIAERASRVEFQMQYFKTYYNVQGGVCAF